MKGYIGHTDAGWWHFLRAQGQDAEANFWRPGGRSFSALSPGEPFFFRLKSPINRIGGFGLFARYASLPVWRVWEVFGPANGVTDEQALLDRVNRLARRTVQLSDSIGCVAVAHCNFFPEDDWLDVPPSFNPQNLSGSVIDLAGAEGRRLWSDCLDRAASVSSPADWLVHAIDRERHGKPQIVLPRLGQGSFRIAVMEAYNNGCAVTGEHSMPALETAHIRPWAQGGTHEISNGPPAPPGPSTASSTSATSPPARTVDFSSAHACGLNLQTVAPITRLRDSRYGRPSRPVPSRRQSCFGGTTRRSFRGRERGQ